MSDVLKNIPTIPRSGSCDAHCANYVPCRAEAVPRISTKRYRDYANEPMNSRLAFANKSLTTHECSAVRSQEVPALC